MHYLVAKNIFKKKRNHCHKCKDDGHVGGGGKERFVIEDMRGLLAS